jgi:hypothetical protein
MPTLGLEPNTCSLHEYYYPTLPPGLLVNTSNFWKYRRQFPSAVEHMGCRLGTLINIKSCFSPSYAEILASLRNRHLAQVTVEKSHIWKNTRG